MFLYSAAITRRIGLISNHNPAIPDLQPFSAAAGSPVFMVPACLLAALTFSDYSSELTQSMNDIFWVTMILPRLLFCAQNCMTAWAIFSENSLDPVYPKATGCINLLTPILTALCLDIHVYNKASCLEWCTCFGRQLCLWGWNLIVHVGI